MKRAILIAALLTISATVFSNPVGKNRAERVAQNAIIRFCAELDDITPGNPVALTDVSQALGFNLLHIYNYRYAEVEGFIIVSGDDCTDPILAFSDDGELNLGGRVTGDNWDSIPGPAFLQQLRHYTNEIVGAREAKAKAPAHVARKWEMLEEGVMPTKGDFYHDHIRYLLGFMKWGQSIPYNSKCPGGSVTGCVATAFGMIMNHWKYPEHGFGQHSYNGADNPAAYPDWTYGVLSADFEHTNYDWEHMDDVIYIGGSDTAIEAVSTLLYHIGVALDMHYTPNGSGCWSLPEYAIFDTSLHLPSTIGADTRIPKYFGYRYDYAGLRDSVHDDTLWMRMLYASLAEGKPIYYAGWAKDTSAAGHSGTSGHGYVLEGYFSDEVDSNLFWVNWGWNGTANGYFKLDAMTPQGYDFTQWQGAIIGLEPDTSYHGYEGIREVACGPWPVVSGGEGTIRVAGAEGSIVTIYDIMGRLITTARVTSSRWQTPARRGIYIVRVGHEVLRKVIVIE